MFKHCLKIVDYYDNDNLDLLFHQNVFPLGNSTSIRSGNRKGFTFEELLRSPFTEL